MDNCTANSITIIINPLKYAIDLNIVLFIWISLDQNMKDEW